MGRGTPPYITRCPSETFACTPLHATKCMMWLLASLTSSSSSAATHRSRLMSLCPFPQRPHHTSTVACRPTASTACCAAKSQHCSVPLTPLPGPPLLRLLLPSAAHRFPPACAACAVPAAPSAHGLVGRTGAAGDGGLPTPPSRPAATGARAGAAQQCAYCTGWQGQQQCW